MINRAEIRRMSTDGEKWCWTLDYLAKYCAIAFVFVLPFPGSVGIASNSLVFENISAHLLVQLFFSVMFYVHPAMNVKYRCYRTRCTFLWDAESKTEKKMKKLARKSPANAERTWRVSFLSLDSKCVYFVASAERNWLNLGICSR